jgi:hypothetical protein
MISDKFPFMREGRRSIHDIAPEHRQGIVRQFGRTAVWLADRHTSNLSYSSVAQPNMATLNLHNPTERTMLVMHGEMRLGRLTHPAMSMVALGEGGGIDEFHHYSLVANGQGLVRSDVVKGEHAANLSPGAAGKAVVAEEVVQLHGHTLAKMNASLYVPVPNEAASLLLGPPSGVARQN